MTAQMDTLDPFETAVATAIAEVDGTPPPDQGNEPATEPLPAGQAEESEAEADADQVGENGEEQVGEVLEPPAEGDSEDGDELFAGLEVEAEAPAEVPDSFTLPGIDEPVSLEELKNGYLRQADYTRKTQEVSASKAQLEKASQFYDALTQHPTELARQLAEAAGLIEPGASPTRVVELPFRSDEDIQSEVDEKVEQALGEHPEVLEARRIIAETWISDEFTRIEGAKDIKLGPKSRQKVLERAYKEQTDNLELVVNAMLAEAEAAARKRQGLKTAAPAKPTGKATGAASTEPPADFWEAAQLAAETLGQSLQNQQ